MFDCIPASDLAAARGALDEHGLALVSGAIERHELDEVRCRLLAAAEEDRRSSRAYVYDADEANQRVWALLKRGACFERLVTNPVAIDLIEHLIDRPMLLSNISANITGPGGGRMALHADQGYVEPPFPPRPLAANAIWMVDDFTVANGATRIVPGSHRRDHGPAATEARRAAGHGTDPDDTVAIEAPAGTLCILDGRVWHQTGTNTTTDERRAGIFAYYVRPYLRTQENWWRSLDDDTLERYRADPLLHELIGFDHYRSLGVVDGMPLDQTRF